MEFELWYLILVPVLFAAGWFGRSFDLKEKTDLSDEKEALYKGVDLLLSNKPDQAVDSFIELAKNDPDTVEMHLSLASLFRRRGEFDRAVKIHNILQCRNDLPPKVRARALSELGYDYLKAGLLDRAEECFLKLADESKSERAAAQKELLNIYETEKEWQKAIDMANILERQTGEKYASRIAQMLCELTALRLRQKDYKAAAQCLEKALSVDPGNKRALIMMGQMLKARGDAEGALAAWKNVGQSSPLFETLVVESIAATLIELGREEEAAHYLEHICERGNNADEIDIASSLLDKNGRKEEAMRLLSERLKTNPTLIGFNRFVEFRLQEDADNEFLKKLQGLLKNLLSRTARYKCTKCGFATRKFLWKCPGCHQWETFPPLRRENLPGN